MRPERLGVIGLGAIGGSVAWGAAKAGISRIIAHTLEPKDGAAAVRAGAVTELANSAARVVRAAELLVLAAPPGETLRLLESLAPLVRKRSVICTDVSSVKRPAVDLALRLGLAGHFAGSHPFAGTEETGFQAARPDRFQGRVVYVTAPEGGGDAAREIADFWERVFDAHPVAIAAEQHDRLLAWISHLPQAVASALANTLSRSSPEGASPGTGALDTTRLAASSVEMWTDILHMNKDAVLAALDRFDDSVAELRSVVERGDQRALADWLAVGADWRRRYRS